MKITDRVYGHLTQGLPGGVSGRLDLVRPAIRSRWGGALNGQRHRRAIVRELSAAFAVDLVIETGTFRGTGAEFFGSVFGVPVISVEANRRFFVYSRAVLAYQQDIKVVLSDSRDFLRHAAASDMSKGTTFFYLDAHWTEDLPLREELEIISKNWASAVVMIDDFEVPGDPGYGFDDYGSGNSLTESYLPKTSLTGWKLLYPSARSAEETGARRGSCVLFSPALSHRAAALSTLRESGPLSS